MPGMPTYLVERYLPGGQEDLPHASGPGIRHLRSILVPEDETCFSLYDAPSARALEKASERAQIAVARISEGVELPGSPKERSSK